MLVCGLGDWEGITQPKDIGKDYEYENPADTGVEILGSLAGAKDDDFFLAQYELSGYEGSARVLYSVMGTLYFDESYHCSCDGLSWQPTAMTKGAVISMAKARLENSHGRDESELQFWNAALLFANMSRA